MSKSKFYCHIDKKEVELPKYLYPHAKHKSNPEQYAGRWRFRTVAGGTATDLKNFITGIDGDIGVTEATEIVQELYKEYWPDLLNEQSRAVTAARGSLLRQFDKYAQHYPSNTKKNWKDISSACRRFCIAVGDDPIHKLTKQQLQEALYTLKPNSQKKLKTCMTMFFQEHVFEYDLCPQITSNPFVRGSRWSLKFTPLENAKTKRLRMLKKDIRSMIAKAEEDGEQWLVDSLKISFLLGIRCDDVVNMKWEDYRPKSQEIIISIHKSINTMGNKKGVRFKITKESHPEVMQILRDRYMKRGVMIREARTRYGVEVEPAVIESAKYVIYRKPDLVPKTIPEGKEQYTQINRQYYSRRFSNYRYKCPDIAERMEAEEGYICLHEVRSLFARIAQVKFGREALEDIREALAHQQKGQTMEKHYMDNSLAFTPLNLVKLEDMYGKEIDENYHDFGELDEAIGEDDEAM